MAETKVVYKAAWDMGKISVGSCTATFTEKLIKLDDRIYQFGYNAQFHRDKAPEMYDSPESAIEALRGRMRKKVELAKRGVEIAEQELEQFEAFAAAMKK